MGANPMTDVEVVTSSSAVNKILRALSYTVEEL